MLMYIRLEYKQRSLHKLGYHLFFNCGVRTNLSTTPAQRISIEVLLTVGAMSKTNHPGAWFPLAGLAKDGYSTEDEATASCMCGSVQLAFVGHPKGNPFIACPRADKNRLVPANQRISRGGRVCMQLVGREDSRIRLLRIHAHLLQL